MKEVFRGILVCSLLLSLACSDSSTAATQSAAPGPQQPQAPPPVVVELAEARDGSLTDTWSFLGQVQPALSAELAAAVAGHVLTVQVREGDRVKKDQVLLTLDSARLQADLAAARAREQGLIAELEVADRQLERIGQVSFPTISEPERERFELGAARVRSQLDTLRAELRRFQVDLARHTVRAPFAGVVSKRNLDPGAWVNVGQPLIGLVSLDDLEIHVDVSSDLGMRLSTGDQVTLAGPTPAQASIAGIVDALDAATRTMRVRLTLAERPRWLLAGMAVDVAFAVDLGDGVLVPRDAVIRGPVAARVIKNADGKATPVDVQVVATAGEQVLVRGQGLAPGDQVVVRGNERLRPGQPLQVK